MSCGQPGCWRAMRASMGRQRGTTGRCRPPIRAREHCQAPRRRQGLRACAAAVAKLRGEPSNRRTSTSSEKGGEAHWARQGSGSGRACRLKREERAITPRATKRTGFCRRAGSPPSASDRRSHKTTPPDRQRSRSRVRIAAAAHSYSPPFRDVRRVELVGSGPRQATKQAAWNRFCNDVCKKQRAPAGDSETAIETRGKRPRQAMAGESRAGGAVRDPLDNPSTPSRRLREEGGGLLKQTEGCGSLIGPIDRAKAARLPRGRPGAAAFGAAPASAGPFCEACTCWNTRLAMKCRNDACQMPPCRSMTSFVAPTADSDEAGHAFQYEAGHLFRSEAGQDSDLKPATQRSLPRIDTIMFRRGG